MPRKPQTDAVATTTADGTTTETATSKPRKPPRTVIVEKIGRMNVDFENLLLPRYASIGEEFSKAVKDAQQMMAVALGLVKALPENWKPSGKGTRKSKTFVNGEFVKAREKFIDLFRDKGYGAGPFKVLGVLPQAKEVKIVTSEGTQYVPLNQVERVVITEQPHE